MRLLPAQLQPYAAALMLLAIALVIAGLAGGGFWFGREFEAGQRAQADMRTYQAAINDLRDQATRITQDYLAASDQLHAIVETYQERVDESTTYYDGLSAQVAALARQRPDLDGCRLGPDGLRIWAAANAGVLGAAPAADRPVADPAMPSDAPGDAGRVLVPAAEPRRIDAAQPPVQPAAPRAGGGRP